MGKNNSMTLIAGYRDSKVTNPFDCLLTLPEIAVYLMIFKLRD